MISETYRVDTAQKADSCSTASVLMAAACSAAR